MSEWYKVTDSDDVELSEDGKDIEIYFNQNYGGACYVTVPVELMKKLLYDAEEQVRSAVAMAEAKRRLEQHASLPKAD